MARNRVCKTAGAATTLPALGKGKGSDFTWSSLCWLGESLREIRAWKFSPRFSSSLEEEGGVGNRAGKGDHIYEGQREK